MSISKLFVKVFGEDIFEIYDGEEEEEGNDDIDDGAATCSKATPEKKDDTYQNMELPEQMVVVKAWLQDKLTDIDQSTDREARLQHQAMSHRLGSNIVVFDNDVNTTVRMSSDRLTLRSQGSFNTVKSNVCVFGGKWMYEVQLHSKGVMQIGWCSNRCSFNDNSGVGDSMFSYGFDGSKKQIWHVSTENYGEKWQAGDIIASTIDFDNDNIEFYRNGISMGIAFSTIARGPGICFYAAVSLSYNQGICANFGAYPFKYPIEGFYPLQAIPIVELAKADMLFGYLVNLSNYVGRVNACSTKKEQKFSTRRTVYTVFCSMLIEKLASFIFIPYVIEKVLLTHIADLCVFKQDQEKNLVIAPGAPDSSLGALLTVLWNYLEADEMRHLLRKIANILLNKYSHTQKGLDYENQVHALNLLQFLCNHERTRRNFLELKFFRKHYLPLFMYTRAPEFNFMLEFLRDQNVWTEGTRGNKIKYLAAIERLSKATEPLYEQQKSFLLTLMTNTDGNGSTPSSRKLFLARLRRYVMDISMEQRPFHSFFLMQSSIQYPLEPQIALSFLCVLTDVCKTLLSKEMPNVDAVIAPKYFVDGTLDYQHFDRVGGVLSHLRKVFRADMIQQIGPERTSQLAAEENVVVRVGEIDFSLFLPLTMPISISAATPVVGRPEGNNTTTFTHFFNPRMAATTAEPLPGNSVVEASLYELIDILIIYYYSVGHKYIVKMATTRDEIATINETLIETKEFYDEVSNKLQSLEHQNSFYADENNLHMVSNLRTKFEQREIVFEKRLLELGRKQSWYRAVAMGKERRLLLTWLLEKVLKTMLISSKTGSLFSFIPEVYINVLPILLDTVMDFSNHDLALQFDMSDVECAINLAAEFLSMHSADSRIVLASCKDSLLQALGTLTCHRAGITALEKVSKKHQNALLRSLLRPYENRAWGQSNWLLLRFWLGDGFAYRDSRQPSVWQGGNQPINVGLCRSRAKNEQHTGLLHHVAPANPSKLYQKLIGQKLDDDEPFATTFLNSVLSQLNWAFSEFILLLQEIQNTALRQENTVFEPKQLRICSMCFELTVSLMRCLEMVLSVAPDIVHNSSRPNSDLILNRICQLISQVLSRVTVPPGCFQFVVDMCSADLNAVTHFPIITAALGILMALLRPELESDLKPAKVTRITRALLTDPSFQFANLEFALGEIKTPILQQSEIPRGNFDPQSRGHIDPLTNDVRLPMPSTSKRLRADPPIIKFTLTDYPSHVTEKEVNDVRRLIEMLRVKQSLLSDITLPSEDSLCPICCAKPIAVIFSPCKHQSCRNCILQHMMNSKVCFYCKTLITTIETSDGTVIYQNTELAQHTLLEPL